MSDIGLYNAFSEKKCHMCKKIFFVQDCLEYGYKIRVHNTRMIYFCSWKCLREYEKKKNGAYEEKKKALIKKQLSGEIV